MRTTLFLSLLTMQSIMGVHALSLGQIRIDSYYNEPLQVTIPLIEAYKENTDGLRIDIADKFAFASAGLERTALLEDIEITLHQSAENGKYLRLSSKAAVRELYLDFILDVNTDAQRISRNITVLVDPRQYQGKPTRKLAAIKKNRSHSMESHSMEATLDKGNDSHSMESHSMEATLDKGNESHSMESHSMEATLDKSNESHSMESHSMEATLDKGNESHSMESHSK